MSKNNNPYDPRKEKMMHKSYIECIKYYKKIEKLKNQLYLGAKIRTNKGIEIIDSEEDINRIYKAYEMAYQQRAKILSKVGIDSLTSWIVHVRNKNNTKYDAARNKLNK